jgi:hypothetical protein
LPGIKDRIISFENSSKYLLLGTAVTIERKPNVNLKINLYEKINFTACISAVFRGNIPIGTGYAGQGNGYQCG